MLPVVGLMLLIMPYLLSRGVSGESVADVEQEVPRLTSEQKKLYGIIGVLAAVLVANTFLKQFTGFALDEKLVLLGFGLLMFIPKIGFLSWEDTRNVPYEIIFLFGAGFSIAAAVSQTGLASDIASKLSFVSGLPLLASYAFMLPIATPPNAIVMSSRIIRIREMATVGLKLNFIGVAVLSLAAYFVWGWMV